MGLAASGADSMAGRAAARPFYTPMRRAASPPLRALDAFIGTKLGSLWWAKGDGWAQKLFRGAGARFLGGAAGSNIGDKR